MIHDSSRRASRHKLSGHWMKRIKTLRASRLRVGRSTASTTVLRTRFDPCRIAFAKSKRYEFDALIQ